MLNQFFFLILHVFYWLECKRLFEKDFNNSHFGPEVKLMHNCCIFISSSAFFTSLSLFSATISASTLSKEVIPGCQALVQVQSSPSWRTRVESMVPPPPELEFKPKEGIIYPSSEASGGSCRLFDELTEWSNSSQVDASQPADRQTD